jgi:hypothetical protein
MSLSLSLSRRSKKPNVLLSFFLQMAENKCYGGCETITCLSQKDPKKEIPFFGHLLKNK